MHDRYEKLLLVEGDEVGRFRSDIALAFEMLEHVRPRTGAPPNDPVEVQIQRVRRGADPEEEDGSSPVELVDPLELDPPEDA